jgi:hypothetical protein
MVSQQKGGWVMATLFRDQRGRFVIQFVRPGGGRPTIRLGRVETQQAETVKGFVEDILASQEAGMSPSPATLAWLAAVPDKVRWRLERAGMVKPRPRALPALLVGASEAARALSICEKTLWTHTQSGDIPHIRVGRRVLYDVEALRAWVRRMGETSSNPQPCASGAQNEA